MKCSFTHGSIAILLSHTSLFLGRLAGLYCKHFGSIPMRNPNFSCDELIGLPSPFGFARPCGTTHSRRSRRSPCGSRSDFAIRPNEPGTTRGCSAVWFPFQQPVANSISFACAEVARQARRYGLTALSHRVSPVPATSEYSLSPFPACTVVLDFVLDNRKCTAFPGKSVQ